MRIAVVGTGSIGRRHLGNLLRLGVSDLVAVSEHHRRKVVDIEGVQIPATDDYAQALQSADAVVIANPTSLHLRYLGQAIAAGRSVYLEKPASHSSAGLAELERDAASRSLIVSVGTQFRFNDALLQVKALIEGGEIGRLLTVVALSGEALADYHPDEDYRLGYAARAELGGGVLLTQIHQIDYLNWLFGGFDRAFAIGVSTPELEIDVETCVSYMLDGVRHLPVVGHLNYLQRPKTTGMEVIGSDGRITWSYETNTVTVAKRGQLEEVIISAPFDRNAMFLAGIKDFLEAIHAGSTPRASLSDGIAALRIVEAIKASVVSGQAEEIVR